MCVDVHVFSVLCLCQHLAAATRKRPAFVSTTIRSVLAVDCTASSAP